VKRYLLEILGSTPIVIALALLFLALIEFYKVALKRYLSEVPRAILFLVCLAMLYMALMELYSSKEAPSQAHESNRRVMNFLILGITFTIAVWISRQPSGKK
jgi:hypothetical protein